MNDGYPQYTWGQLPNFTWNELVFNKEQMREMDRVWPELP